MTSNSLEKVFERLGVKAYIKLGDGERASFYLTLSEYKNQLRLTLFTVNEQTNWIGGRYSIPIELAGKVFYASGRLLKELKKMKETEKDERLTS